MYKYYQTGERTPWKAIPDAPDVETKAISAGAKKVTILAVSEVINEDATEKGAQSYKGPWYSDIDNKDIAEAIRSARELVGKLRDLGVPDPAILLFASGGKGFHILVPALVFSTGRPLKNLPAIYREMALDLHVLGLDFQVYSGGRGVCWRLPNIERENGRYRVPITIDELMGMDPAGYADITSRPRILPAPDTEGLEAPGMRALMDDAKRRVKLKPKPAKPVPAAELEQFRESPPNCVHALADFKVRQSANFNEIGFQLGVYLIRSETSDQLSASLISRMAENGHSTKYSTPRQRLTHIQGLVDYLRHASQAEFSCSAMRSVLSSSPCEGCTLSQGMNAFEEGDLNAEVGIEERPDGYYAGDRKLSTFTIRPSDVYLEASQDGEVTRRVGIKVAIQRDVETLDTQMLSEDAWVSCAKFKGELRGLKDASFFGGDTDVQRIKYLVCNEQQDMNEIIQVYAAGIHVHKVAGQRLNVYVEPGFSVNEIRIKGTHELNGSVSNPPHMDSLDVPLKGDERLNKLVKGMFNMNSPLVMAQLLGWVSACHLKTLFMSRYSQFPLVNLWGNAGSGKSMTSVLVTLLGGCDYTEQGNAPKTLASITQWALIDEVSKTTTIPRILEEYNKSKMSTTKMYNYCGEIMKAAWNGQTIARGRISRSTANGAGRTGAEVIEIPILSPIMVISEQAIHMPALQQRMVQIAMSHKDRKGKDKVFDKVYNDREYLLNLSLAMMIKSLSTHRDWVIERMDYWEEHVSKDLIERPRYSYKALLVGLDFLELVMNELELSAASCIDDLRTQLTNTIETKAKTLTTEKHRTEVDSVMQALGIMAQMTDRGAANWVISGVHYVCDADYLYLDVKMAHAMYKLYMRQMGDVAVMDTPEQMQALLNQEYYFETDKAICEPLKLKRTVTQLSLAKMQEKGIDTTMF